MLINSRPEFGPPLGRVMTGQKLEKSSDADLLREMVGFAAHRLMELEVESLTGAAHGERSPQRINHRNGYRDRVWETRAGAVALPLSGRSGHRGRV